MSIHRYQCWAGPMPTTGFQTGANSANGTKTLLQVAAPSTRMLTIISWGYSWNVVPPAASVVELVETDAAATVTAHAASGIMPLVPGAPASLVTLGTAATGYNASAEGATTAVRVFDSQDLTTTAGTNELNYSYQFMPDERPIVNLSHFLRVRVNTNSATPNLQAWICWEE